MSARVRLFAGAAEAVGVTEVQVAAGDLAGTLTELIALAERTALGTPIATDVLSRCALVVDGVRTADLTTPVRDGSLVDVLPPFAGG